MEKFAAADGQVAFVLEVYQSTTMGPSALHVKRQYDWTTGQIPALTLGHRLPIHAVRSADTSLSKMVNELPCFCGVWPPTAEEAVPARSTVCCRPMANVLSAKCLDRAHSPLVYAPY